MTERRRGSASSERPSTSVGTAVVGWASKQSRSAKRECSSNSGCWSSQGAQSAKGDRGEHRRLTVVPPNRNNHEAAVSARQDRRSRRLERAGMRADRDVLADRRGVARPGRFDVLLLGTSQAEPGAQIPSFALRALSIGERPPRKAQRPPPRSCPSRRYALPAGRGRSRSARSSSVCPIVPTRTHVPRLDAACSLGQFASAVPCRG